MWISTRPLRFMVNLPKERESPSVIAVRDMNHLNQVVDNANKIDKLLVLEFMGSVSYRSTCEFMKPTLDSIAANYRKTNKADFCTADVDNKEFKDLTKEYKVQVLPTFLMIKDYEAVERIVAPDKEELVKSIEKFIPPK